MLLIQHNGLLSPGQKEEVGNIIENEGLIHGISSKGTIKNAVGPKQEAIKYNRSIAESEITISMNKAMREIIGKTLNLTEAQIQGTQQEFLKLCQAEIAKLPFVQQARVSKIFNSYLSKNHNIDETGFKDRNEYDYTLSI